MGKLIFFVSFLIFLDLLFIMTGQICLTGDDCTMGGIIFETLMNLGSVSGGKLFLALIGDVFNLVTSTTGILGIIGGVAAVTIGSIVTKSDSILFLAALGTTFAVFVNDFVNIYLYLSGLNQVLATIVMGGIILTFIFVIIDWARGKD